MTMRDECIKAAACDIAIAARAPKEAWRAYIPHATAAFDAIIERMRIPDSATTQAGFDAEAAANPFKTQPHHVVPAIWQAMVDAIGMKS